MQSNSTFILKYGSVDLSKVTYDEFVESEDKQIMVSKIWYQKDEVSRPQTFYIQVQDLKVDEVKSGNMMAILSDSTLFSQLDKKSLEVAKSKSVSKKFGLKNPKYKPMITEMSDTNNNSFDALKLAISDGSNGGKTTQFFVGKNKISKNFDEVKGLLKAGTNVKVILEVDGLMVDTKHNNIYTNIVLKQVLVPMIVPLRLELSEYSFIDSDNEEETKQMSTKFVALNTQTEQETEKKDEKKDEKKENKKGKKEEEKRPKQLPSPSPESDDGEDGETEDDTDTDNVNSDSSGNETSSDDDEDVQNFLKSFTNKK